MYAKANLYFKHNTKKAAYYLSFDRHVYQCRIERNISKVSGIFLYDYAVLHLNVSVCVL